MTRRSLSALAFLLAALVARAADPVGRIVYLEGSVTIVRDEDALAAASVKEGLSLENFDLLKTGADGEIEVLVSSPSAPATTLRVGPRTQFSLEIGKVGGKQQTTIDLVAGSVALKCAKLTGAQALRVQTESATLGVRGTSFTVAAPATGDILVTCDEGEVEVTADDGSVLRAAAGEAVERRRGAKLVRLALAGIALEKAREAWMEERTAAWRRDPLASLRVFAAVYDLQLGRFNRTFDRVVKSRRDVFAAWRQESRAGIVGRLIAALKEGAQLRRDIRDLRAALFKLERTYVPARRAAGVLRCPGHLGQDRAAPHDADAVPPPRARARPFRAAPRDGPVVRPPVRAAQRRRGAARRLRRRHVAAVRGEE